MEQHGLCLLVRVPDEYTYVAQQLISMLGLALPTAFSTAFHCPRHPALMEQRRRCLEPTVLLLLTLWPQSGWTSNPIVLNGTSIADPHIHIFDGQAFMYAGRDVDPHARGFVMPDWSVWRSSDLVSWTKVTTISPNKTYIGAGSTECWASDVARIRTANSTRYAFFFSHGGISMGVMTASSPSLGDASDALGRPLVSSSRRPEAPSGVWVTNQTRGAYDPSLLVDDNATYVSFGVRDTLDSSVYLIARLDHSLTSLAEEPRRIVFLPRADGAEMPSDDKSTLHKWNGVYYLSAGSYYSTATSLYYYTALLLN